jgi:hypothetical protein
MVDEVRGNCSGASASGATRQRAEWTTLATGSAAQANLRADDPINVQYTSGTTGFPKGQPLPLIQDHPRRLWMVTAAPERRGSAALFPSQAGDRNSEATPILGVLHPGHVGVRLVDVDQRLIPQGLNADAPEVHWNAAERTGHGVHGFADLRVPVTASSQN